MSRTYGEAVVMGMCIALTVWAVRAWLGEAGLGVRAAAFLLAGVLLCLLQAWIGRWRSG